jgi:hypothetical protein
MSGRDSFRLEALNSMFADAGLEFPLPIFEIVTTTGSIKIYADGVVEGCDNLTGIVNFVPHVASPEAMRLFSKSWQSALSPTSNPISKASNKLGSEGVSHLSAASSFSISEQCLDATGEK